MSKIISVVGAGSWGTALAISLAQKDYEVRIWGRDLEQLENMNKTRQNSKYLPGIDLPENIKVFSDIEKAIDQTDIILLSVSSQAVRNVINQFKTHCKPDQVIVNVAKGIEKNTLKRISEIVKEELPNNPYAVLSGPSHAEEVSRNMPTTLVVASSDQAIAEYVQDVFISPRLRIYTNPDVIGVELGGTLKNIIALCAGISDGLGFGDNAKAALMTRGMVEISRLGRELGASKNTFSGLSGVGDLIVTCTSMYSRNRRCGILLGEGVKLEEAIKEIGMVVEGVVATEAAFMLAKKYKIEMPITSELYHVLFDAHDVRASVTNLMLRKRKHEMENVAENWEID